MLTTPVQHENLNKILSFPTSNFTIVIPRIEPPFKVYCVARVFVGVHVYRILLLILLRFSCCTGVVNIIFIRIVIFVLYLQTGMFYFYFN
jgi:hypothetical protein